jgi:hypothetical protein
MTIVLTILVLAAWWLFVRHQNRKTHNEIRRQSEMKEILDEKNEIVFNRKMTLLQEQDGPELAPYLDSGSEPRPWCMEGTADFYFCKSSNAITNMMIRAVSTEEAN